MLWCHAGGISWLSQTRRGQPGQSSDPAISWSGKHWDGGRSRAGALAAGSVPPRGGLLREVGQRLDGLARGSADLPYQAELRSAAGRPLLGAGAIRLGRSGCAPAAPAGAGHGGGDGPRPAQRAALLDGAASGREPGELSRDFAASDDPLPGRQEGGFWPGSSGGCGYWPLSMVCRAPGGPGGRGRQPRGTPAGGGAAAPPRAPDADFQPGCRGVLPCALPAVGRGARQRLGAGWNAPGAAGPGSGRLVAGSARQAAPPGRGGAPATAWTARPSPGAVAGGWGARRSPGSEGRTHAAGSLISSRTRPRPSGWTPSSPARGGSWRTGSRSGSSLYAPTAPRRSPPRPRGGRARAAPPQPHARPCGARPGRSPSRPTPAERGARRGKPWRTAASRVMQVQIGPQCPIGDPCGLGDLTVIAASAVAEAAQSGESRRQMYISQAPPAGSPPRIWRKSRQALGCWPAVASLFCLAIGMKTSE